MFFHKSRELIVEEKDVTTVLTAINNHQGFFSNTNKHVGNCGWNDDATKWYVTFYASAREWGRTMGDLSKIGEINVKVRPGGKTDLYFTKK